MSAAVAPTIHKVLEISTSHLLPIWRDFDEIAGCLTYPVEGGLLLWVPDDLERCATVSAPQSEAMAILRRARELGCAYVWFAEIADVDPTLPTFKYEG